MKKKFFAIIMAIILITGISGVSAFAADKEDKEGGAFFISKIRIYFSEATVVNTVTKKNGGTYTDEKGKEKKMDIEIFDEPVEYLDINCGDYTQIYTVGDNMNDTKLYTSLYPKTDSKGKFVGGIIDGTVIKTSDIMYFSGIDLEKDDADTENPNNGKDIKVKAISVFISALGDEQYVSTEENAKSGDPQAQNEITITRGDRLENIKIAQDYADHYNEFYKKAKGFTPKEVKGKILGTINSQTTRSSINWTSKDEDNSFVEKKITFDEPISGKDYIYLNVNAKTMQPEGAKVPDSALAKSGTNVLLVPIMSEATETPWTEPEPVGNNAIIFIAIGGGVVVVGAVVALILVLGKKKKK